MRASELIGRTAYDASGEPLGRVADLELDEDDVIVAAVVTKGPWGRLLGYERETAHGPWLLEAVARLILRRDSRRIPWPELRLSPDRREP